MNSLSNKRVEPVIGEVFGRLTVIADLGLLPRWGGKRRRCVRVRCQCGTVEDTTINQLRNGIKRSCGCLHREQLIARNTRHGAFRSRTWKVWNGMIARVKCKGAAGYKNYGGRGIEVAPEWLIFENFLSDMGEAPDGQELDRIDNDGPYSRDNCRWATRLVNARNTRKNVRLTFNGYTACLSEWAVITGIDQRTLSSRKKAGWSDEDILTKPTRITKHAGISKNWCPPKT